MGHGNDTRNGRAAKRCAHGQRGLWDDRDIKEACPRVLEACWRGENAAGGHPGGPVGCPRGDHAAGVVKAMGDILKRRRGRSATGRPTETPQEPAQDAEDAPGSTRATFLASKMSGDRGEPMVRRLREFCKCIVFSKPKP